MDQTSRLEVPIQGMDCAECTQHVQKALASLPGVHKVDVFLASEKAVIFLDPQMVGLNNIRQAVKSAGYSVAPSAEETSAQGSSAAPALDARWQDYSRKVLTLFGMVFGAVLLIVVAGEGLGLFDRISASLPWYLVLPVILAGGYPIFKNVLRATLRGQVISHTLMTLGMIAALVVGEWVTAAVVVFFMRIGDYAESFTTERARRAVKDLTALAPQKARIEQGNQEIELPIAQVQPGDTIIVRPGEKIPVDGQVLTGHATLDQSALTGESMPVEAGKGSNVYAATLVRLGSLRLRAEHTGADTTFGKVIQLVEQAEAHRGDVQRIADRFSTYYLPVVAGIAALTFLFRRDPLATAAVLVVACSCAFALATPIAMLASIGAGARRGLLIKGGKYLEILARADVLLMDKTGTLTLGQPRITHIYPINGLPEEDLLQLSASAERYSEHPLGEAVRRLAGERGLALEVPEEFSALPGLGVQARIRGRQITVGSLNQADPQLHWTPPADLLTEGLTLIAVTVDGQPAGILTAADTLRPDVATSIAAVRKEGIQSIELLSGDNAQAVAGLAHSLGVNFRAGLLPEDKIRIVKEYQAAGHVVVMVGDGVNDAPALAQADVGIAMGAVGSDIAIEAAHMALLREDWLLIPAALQIAKRTMRVVKLNIAFTAVYNLIGLSLAALGFLPPVLAAAAQSLPDLGILANSSRLLKQGEKAIGD